MDECTGGYARAWLERDGSGQARYAWIQVHGANGAPVAAPLRLSQSVHYASSIELGFGGDAYRVFWGSNPRRPTGSSGSISEVHYASVDATGNVVLDDTVVRAFSTGGMSLGSIAVNRSSGRSALAYSELGSDTSTVDLVAESGKLLSTVPTDKYPQVAWASKHLLIVSEVPTHLGPRLELQSLDDQGAELMRRSLGLTYLYARFGPRRDGKALLLAHPGGQRSSHVFELEPESLAGDPTVLDPELDAFYGAASWGNQALSIIQPGALSRSIELIEVAPQGLIRGRRVIIPDVTRTSEIQLDYVGGRFAASLSIGPDGGAAQMLVVLDP